MRLISFYFERVGDILDLIDSREFKELIQDKKINICFDVCKNELTVSFNEPFDRHTLNTVLYLVSFYAIFN